MGIQILSTKQFLSLGNEPTKEMTESEFLNRYYNADLDGDGCAGWKFKGKTTTDIEEAKQWYNTK